MNWSAMARTTTVFTLLCLAPLTLLPAPTAGEELPVVRVVLYKNGVAYVERGGELAGAGSITLAFRAEEMADILKSLSVSVDSGAVERVRFSTDESLEEKLRNFPFRILPGQGLTPLLDTLRGARISARRGSETIDGVIISAREVPASERQPAQNLLTLLTTDGSIDSHELLSLDELRFADPRLQQQLADYLQIVTEVRNQERRILHLDLAGGSSGRLTARYLTPMPVWKSSYRLLFPSEGQALLEGWAVVDNTSGEEWQDISLALVSGRPVSFRTNLYPPVHVERPLVELPGIAALAPLTYETRLRGKSTLGASMARGGRDAEADTAVFAETMPAAAPLAQLAPPPQKTSADGLEKLLARESAFAATASGSEAGALFAYNFPGRVTVRQGESVMLPFLQRPVTASRLLIYSERQTVRNHPMLAVELANDTGLTLDGGPVTLFDGGEYAGEAMFETTLPEEKRLLSYGLDPGTTIRLEPGSGQRQVEQVRIHRGVMSISLRSRQISHYRVSNSDRRAKSLLLERPLQANYQVISPTPSETTATSNRFRLELPAEGSAELRVVEEYPHTEIVRLANLDSNRLLVYSRNSEISAAARAAIDRIIDQQRLIDRAGSELADGEERLAQLGTSMERLRHNLESLNQIRGQEAQVQRLAEELGRLQSEADNREKANTQQRDRLRGLQEELAKLIENTAV